MIQFKYTILYVRNVARSIDFYTSVFGIQPNFISPEGDYGELITEGVKLAFASHELARTNLSRGFSPSDQSVLPQSFELGFVTDDVESLLELALKEGASLVESPKKKEWGQVVAYIQDLDGILVELSTPIN